MKRGNESKPHIGIFGRCNAGKSTLLNLLSGEAAAIVSPERGTTTDPVKRSMEILDFAPVVMIDTAGVDDTTLLGKERLSKTLEVMYQIDMAIIVYRGQWTLHEELLLSKIKDQSIQYIIVNNLEGENPQLSAETNKISLSLLESDENGRNTILNTIKTTLPEYSYTLGSMFGKRVSENEIVVLVCPIDSEAPAGRMILPQVQAIRDLLDKNSIAVVVQPEQLAQIIATIPNVKLVVTDSQIIDVVNKIVDKRAEITTFSILLAALKGDMALYKQGLMKIDELKDGDKILMLESCSHQTSCEDIGRVKIPKWLREYTGKKLEFDFVQKLSALPEDMSSYAMAVQCGACMVTRRQLQGRIHRVAAHGLPITNYGMLISKIRK